MVSEVEVKSFRKLLCSLLGSRTRYLSIITFRLLVIAEDVRSKLRVGREVIVLFSLHCVSTSESILRGVGIFLHGRPPRPCRRKNGDRMGSIIRKRAIFECGRGKLEAIEAGDS